MTIRKWDMHQFAAFYFQLVLWSIEVYDQPVCIPFSVTSDTVVQGNASNRLTACDKETLLISNFCHVVNVVFFLSGDSPASEFCVPTFQNTFFDVLLTLHLSIILLTDQLNAQILFYNNFIIFLYMFWALCDHHQEVKIVLYSIWYHHTCRWPSQCTG